VLVKHQLLILNRAPNLSAAERFIRRFLRPFHEPSPLLRCAIVLKPSTLLDLDRMLAQRKYRLLFSSECRRQPGPKGPNRELIDAVVEMKRRNPNWGCPRIARSRWLAALKSTRMLFAVSWAFITGRNRTREARPGSRSSPHEGQFMELRFVPL
jgi:hypothetical protein